MHSKTSGLLLKVASVLWVIWGLVHMFAGIMTMAKDTGAAVAGIADAVDPLLLQMSYPEAAGAVINQHGFNLFWIGAATVVGGVLIWRRRVVAIFVTALIGWVTDLGYFIFMDLGGFVHFVPGTVMTIVSTLAVLLSFWAHFVGNGARELVPGS